MAKKPKRAAANQRELFDRGQFEGGESGSVETVQLREATEARYLNYALSVITSRALPDVRDGLKPVQRRILYTMGQQGLRPEARHRKCAKVVGDVMGNYHPHGDSAIYDALVRMAQPFALRVPLVDGSGNFGSLDGDAAAAMRYTECRLAPASDALLSEIGERTVDFRPNYDGTRSEPVVLPARLPNLLVNGSTGIAVGMATNIPPHNPGEVCKALLRLLKQRATRLSTIVDIIPAPDFPTGGRLLNSRAEIEEIYRTGSGSLRLRATHAPGPKTRSSKIVVITSIPYALTKSSLVERIAEVIQGSKLPQLLDVRDVSTDDVRIELELKRDADEQMVLGYLYKHTPLQTTFGVNLTCLVPTANPEVGRPERLGLVAILLHFLDFRLSVVTRKLDNELRLLSARLHVLEGFESVFDALDEILAIIRKSEGKQDSATRIMDRFGLDADQTDAILELKLYRLAKLEILVIRKELEDKRARAKEVRRLLRSEPGRWAIVKSELEELRQIYRSGPLAERRTIVEEAADEPEFSAQDFIVEEDNVVIVTRDGWVKRQREVKDLAKTKLRRGDEVLAAEPGSTKATIVFLSNLGTAYTARIADIPASTGHGEPIQKLFRLKDGERIIQACSLDPRWIGQIAAPSPGDQDTPPPIHALAVTSDGYALRFGLAGFEEPSTRSGRRYARPRDDGEVIGVEVIDGTENVIAATRSGRALICQAAVVNFLAGAGRGVILIKLAKDDGVLGFIVSQGDRDLLTVTTSRGAEKTISTTKYEVTGRGGRGRELLKLGHFTGILRKPVEPPDPLS